MTAVEPVRRTTVAAVHCQTYERELVCSKVAEAIALSGGFPAVVKPGSRILVKPNLLTAKPPEAAATTHPEVVRGVIHALRKAGVARIAIADSPAGNYPWDELWTTTGMAAVAAEENIELIPLVNFRKVEIAGLSVPVFKELEEFDAFVSVPKLKTHLLTKVTGAVKNSYGLIVGDAKGAFHSLNPSPRAMSEFVAAVYGVVKPCFVVMDAIECMEGEGPAGGRAKQVGALLAGTDGLAVDACACAVFGYESRDVPSLAATMRGEFGVGDPAAIEKVGDAWQMIQTARAKRSIAGFLSAMPEPMFHILTFLLRCRPVIVRDTCSACGLCAKACPQKAISSKGGRLVVNGGKCVLCMCCMEACPHKAIELLSPATRLTRGFRRLLKR